MIKKSKLQIIYSFFSVSLLMVVLLGGERSYAQAPMIRIKTGTSSLTVNAGTTVVSQPLAPMVTFEPSILWAVPTFSARLGVHYLQDLGGAYGMTPISGVGLSGYYHMYGISTTYTTTEDGIVVTKSIPGPFLYAGLTPVNFNLNKSEDNFFFSAVLYDVSVGVGYDYPITQNLVISAEYILRNGVSSGSSENVGYKGSTLFISFGTSYF